MFHKIAVLLIIKLMYIFTDLKVGTIASIVISVVLVVIIVIISVILIVVCILYKRKGELV